MSEHRFVTKLAIDALSPADRDIWQEHAEPLIQDYCTWPDKWFGVNDFDRIDPYMIVMDELPFHYPPLSEARYHWGMTRSESGEPQMKLVSERPNLNWQFMRDGFRHYLSTVSEELRQGRPGEAAKSMGILLHVLQDTHELHSLEGPWGSDLFVLDRVMPWPEGDRYISPTSLIARTHKEGSIDGYQPKLLGTSVGEAVLLLYERYVHAALDNRRIHVPMVLSEMQGDTEQTNRYLAQVNETIARLSADALHTVVALARGEFDEAEVEALRSHRLDPMAAVQKPWNGRGAYRFHGTVPNACLDREMHLHPLRVRQADGSTKAFEQGWGTGGHVDMMLVWEIPANVYDRVKGQVGLHEPLGDNGGADLTVLVDGEAVQRHRLEPGAGPLDLDVPIREGGELRFRVQEKKGIGHHENHLVWGDVRLVKA